ncbi:hypothetical protein Pmani_015447 [Petrolisthes manimaculis]|uniref:SH2 domain-containing protein n=1 Tax=Petrolisthes manimaculis TaxID=1843537 RepID=A0AAE1PTQ8_9EUCA|nr:hypothetical protein Pmani_015447 [Petrolisthes manimaculis]KAK4313184.1 hypothetical protein Pmani_015447 [Petrolisthes manimaculis]
MNTGVTGVSKVRFSVPSMEFVWETDPHDGKKVTFLVGVDGEPVVLVLGSEDGDGSDDVDQLLQERARRQADLESDILKRAAEEELDKLVRLSRSTVQAMEEEAIKNISKEHDPAREAVVRKLSGLSIWDINNKSDISSISSVPSNLSSISSVPSTLSSIPSNPSTLSSNPSTLSSNPSTLSSLPSTLSSVPSTPSTLPSNSSTLPSLPSTLSSDTSFLPPPPSSLTILEGREEEEEEDRSQLSSPPTSVMGVAAQIRRFEQLSEGSLEALKTATLERARRRRQKEILEHLRSQVVEVQQQHLDHRLWQEQERKAKEAERRIREIARRAREEHRRTSIHTPTPSPTSSTPTTPTTPNANTINGYSYSRVYSPQPLFGQDINGNIKSDDFSNNNLIQRSSNSSSSSVVGVCVGVRQRAVRPPKPPSRAAIVTWFRDEELPKGAGLDPTHTHIAPWFHGIISRTEAEEILLSIGDVGSFLVRVSERIWGYAISYRAHQRCRHYLIDVTGGRYTFFGSHASAHRSLSDLVEFHKREAITSTGGELLTQPCGQPQTTTTTTTSSSLSSSSSLSPDYLELFTGTPYMST